MALAIKGLILLTGVATLWISVVLQVENGPGWRLIAAHGLRVLSGLGGALLVAIGLIAEVTLP